MSFTVRFTEQAEEDLVRLYEYLLQRDPGDWSLAERALDAIRHGVAMLEVSPFSCRKVKPNDPFLREQIIPFGHAGYVALFEIENKTTVTILAIRHQREDDYH